MSAHTKEPWRAEPYSDPQWAIFYGERGLRVIALTSQGNDEANAKRIVACVNACAGLPTVLLAEQRVADLLAQVHALATAPWTTNGQGVLALARIADLVAPWRRTPTPADAPGAGGA